MKGLSFFSHDVNARFDRKIRKLRKKYGSDALLFWDLLEEMGDSDGYYPLADIEFLSTDLDIDDERKQEIIEYAIEIGLFVKTDEDEIYSQRLTQFMQDFSAKSQKASAAAKSKGKDNKDDDNEDDNAVKQTQSERKADAEQTQSERKAKKERKERNKERNKQNKTKQSDADAVANVVDVVVSSPTDSTALKEQAKSISAEIDSLQAVSDQLDKLIAENTTESVDDSILIDDADEIIFGEEDKIEVPQEPEEPNADEILNTLIDPVLKADTDKLRQELVAIGMSESVADVELAMHDNSYIRSKIALLKAQSNIQNPSAWLLKAIENDYKPNVPTKPVSQPSSTDLLSEKDDFQEFQKQFKRLMNYDFNNKRLYTQAVTTLGTPSAVVKVLNSFAKYKGTDGLKDLIHRHNIRSFDDLLTNEKAMGSLTAYAAAEDYKETQRDPAYIALMQKMGADKKAI